MKLGPEKGLTSHKRPFYENKNYGDLLAAETLQFVHYIEKRNLTNFRKTSPEKTELTVFAWDVIKNTWVKPPGGALKEFWGGDLPPGPWDPGTLSLYQS